MAANEILSATPLSSRRVRVMFAEDGVAAPTSDESALTVGNWALSPDEPLPGYTPEVASVEAVELSGGGVTGVVLTAGADLTPGIVYLVRVVSVSGIVEDESANVEIFTSLPLAFPAGRDIDLAAMVPAINLREDGTEELARFVACLQEPINLLWGDVDRWVEIFDCDLAPEQFLDLMLRDLGSPFAFADDLAVVEKRRLCHLLVQIYQLKGTAKGLQAAILFFMGVRSEFLSVRGLGSSLDGGATINDSYGNVPTANQFVLGDQGAWQFIAKLGTTVASQTAAGDPSPQAGGLLTSAQVDKAKRLIDVMKPAHLVLREGAEPVLSGATVSQRNAIQDNGDGSVTLLMEVLGTEKLGFWEGSVPGVNQFNSGAFVEAGAFTGRALNYVPPGFRWWNGVGWNLTAGTFGLLGNEVTNLLTKPGLAATPGTRKITLSWGPVTNATAYRIYFGSNFMLTPLAADNAGDPIVVSADLTEYVDPLESGTFRQYIITPVWQDFEGFFSEPASATAG